MSEGHASGQHQAEPSGTVGEEEKKGEERERERERGERDG